VSRLYKVFVEAYIYADDEDDAKDIGYDALIDKLNCGSHDVEVEEVDENG
jgi:hypothetical protein